MALSQTKILENGLSVADAYIRIDTLSGNKGSLTLSVNSYISKVAYEVGTGYVEQKFYEFSPSVDEGSPNFIKQGYEHLKSLLEYDGSIDVLE